MYVCLSTYLNSHPPISSQERNHSNMKASCVCFLLLFMSFMFSATASRSFGWTKSEVALQQVHFQNKIDTTSYKDSIEFDELTTRRMDFENTDYGGTGANDRHDPKSPGRP